MARITPTPPDRAPKPQKPPQVFTPESIAMALRFNESARKRRENGMHQPSCPTASQALLGLQQLKRLGLKKTVPIAQFRVRTESLVGKFTLTRQKPMKTDGCGKRQQSK